MNHLISVYVYCAFDKLQYEFSKTYRYLEGEKYVYEVIKRHSNYFYMARYIKEAIGVFGIQYIEGYNNKVYHGVNEEMIFESYKFPHKYIIDLCMSLLLHMLLFHLGFDHHLYLPTHP